jgi:hypothetical protein
MRAWKRDRGICCSPHSRQLLSEWDGAFDADPGALVEAGVDNVAITAH